MDPEYVSKTSRKIKVHIVDIKTGKLIQKEGRQTKKKAGRLKQEQKIQPCRECVETGQCLYCKADERKVGTGEQVR